MRRSNHENIDVLMLIGLVTGEEEGEGGGKSNSKVGTRWVRQLHFYSKVKALFIREIATHTHKDCWSTSRCYHL